MAMTPGTSVIAEGTVETFPQSKTYHVDHVNKRISGHIDGLESVRQAVTKILNTERQSYLIYSPDYGVELERFIGQEKEFVMADIERTICDALLCDDRIQEITDFTMTYETDKLSISFTLQTIYGSLGFGKEVVL